MSYIKNIIEGIIEENPSLAKKAIEAALYEKMAERLEFAREDVASSMFVEDEDICEECEEEWDDEEVLEAKKKDEDDDEEDEDEDEEDEDEEDMKEAKKADKDYDGDGEVESGTEEWKGSRDKAIKRAMAARKESFDGINEISTGLLLSARREAGRDRTSALDGAAMGEKGAAKHAAKRTRLINKIDKRLAKKPRP